MGGDPGDRHPDAGVWRPHTAGGFRQPLGRHHKGLDQSETEQQDRGAGLTGQWEPVDADFLKQSIFMLFPNITPRTGFSILFCTGIIFTLNVPNKAETEVYVLEWVVVKLRVWSL